MPTPKSQCVNTSVFPTRKVPWYFSNCPVVTLECVLARGRSRHRKFQPLAHVRTRGVPGAGHHRIGQMGLCAPQRPPVFLHGEGRGQPLSPGGKLRRGTGQVTVSSRRCQSLHNGGDKIGIGGAARPCRAPPDPRRAGQGSHRNHQPGQELAHSSGQAAHQAEAAADRPPAENSSIPRSGDGSKRRRPWSAAPRS